MVQTAVFGFLLICLIVGFWKATSIKDLTTFALGEKKISNSMLFMTMLATYLGAVSTFGVIECINNIGLIFFLQIFLKPIQWAISSIFYLNIYKFEGCITLNEIMERLYGKAGFIMAFITNFIISIGISSIQVMMLGSILNTFCNLSLIEGTFLGAIIMAIYSATGGIKGVIITDFLQGLVFLMVIPLVFILCLQNNTISGLINDFPAEKSWILPQSYSQWVIVIGLVMQSLIPQGGNSMFIQRMLISRDRSQLLSVFTSMCWVDFGVALCIGVIGLSVSNIIGAETISRADIFNLIASLPEWLTAVIVLGLIALILSTCDSCFNISAVMFVQDAYKKFQPNKSDTHYVNIARASTIFIALISTFIALNTTFIFSILVFFYTIDIGLRIIPEACGFLGIKFTQRQFITACVMATLGIGIGYLIEGHFKFYALMLGAVFNTITLAAFRWRPKVHANMDIILPFATYCLLITRLYITKSFDILDLMLIGLALFFYVKIFCHLRKMHIKNTVAYVLLALYVILAHSNSVKWIETQVIFSDIGVWPIICFNIGLLLIYCLYLLHVNFTRILIALAEFKNLDILDPLTKLYNQRYMNALKLNETCSLVFADLNDFKPINEQYGHDAGNEVLQYVAELLKKLCANTDNVPIRYSGDEFIIVLPSGNHEEVASRLNNALISSSIPIRSKTGEEVTLSTSASVVTVKYQGSLKETIKNVDQIMSATKNKLQAKKQDIAGKI